MGIMNFLVRHKKKLEIGGWIFMAVIGIVGVMSGFLTDTDKMEAVLLKCGIWAPLVFVFVQAVQVVVPILPGAIGCAFGVVFFGSLMGFVYNYVGICIGSVLAFLFARRCGAVFVKQMTGSKFYDKYKKFLESEKKFERIFAVLIFLPAAPDDFLCYLAGLSNMSLRRFTWIILLGKPLAIFLYSTALYQIIGQALKIFG